MRVVAEVNNGGKKVEKLDDGKGEKLVNGKGKKSKFNMFKNKNIDFYYVLRKK